MSDETPECRLPPLLAGMVQQVTIEPRRISHSELKVFQRCKRKWWLSQYRRLAPKLTGPVGPLQSGTRIHIALEAYYTPGQDADPRAVLEDVLKEAYSEYISRCAELDTDPDPMVVQQFSRDAELERAMIEGYAGWLAETGVDSDLTVIDVERQVSVTAEQLGMAWADNNLRIVGKMDARVIDNVTGHRRFIDHKTAKTFVDMLPGLRQDSQMLHYHLLEMVTAAEGETCDGALYNVLRKVKRGKTAKPPFYAREVIDHNEDEIESYRLRLIGLIMDVFQLEDRIEQFGAEGVRMFAQPNRTRDCSWDCPFNTICPLFDDGSRVEDAIREQFTEQDPLARYTEPGV